MPNVKHEPIYRGFHRMLSGPLDDCSVFYSIDDLLRYVKYGAAYEGQHITLVDSKNAFDFDIVKDNDNLKLYPLFNFRTDYISEYSSDAILVYRHDFEFENSEYEYSEDNLCILNNESIYSIANLFKLFIDSQGQYKCCIKKWLPINTSSSLPQLIRIPCVQTFSPFDKVQNQNGIMAYDNMWLYYNNDIALFSPSMVSEFSNYIELYLCVKDTILIIGN